MISGRRIKCHELKEQEKLDRYKLKKKNEKVG